MAPSFAEPLRRPGVGIPADTERWLVHHLLPHSASWRTFDFLGFHVRTRESHRWRGKWYAQYWPSQRAMAAIRAKVRDRTQRRHASLPLEDVVARLNSALQGWGNYFRVGNSSQKFSAIDAYVHKRLAKLARVKRNRPGRAWTTRYDYAWVTRLGVHRLSGTVRYRSANATR